MASRSLKPHYNQLGDVSLFHLMFLNSSRFTGYFINGIIFLRFQPLGLGMQIFVKCRFRYQICVKYLIDLSYFVGTKIEVVLTTFIKQGVLKYGIHPAPISL